MLGCEYIAAPMLATKKLLATTQRATEREAHRRRFSLQRKCEYLDGEIDKLVYAFYGLTEAEIRIVEG